MADQQVVKRGVLKLAKKHGIPVVASNDCHYVHADDAEAHDVLLCIGTGKVVSDENRMRYTSNQYYMKSGEEMAALFGKECPEALDNTLRVAEMCAFRMEFGEYHLPRYEVPDGQTIDGYFEAVAREGFQKRLPEIRHTIESGEVKAEEKDYLERLDYEFRLIKQTGFSGYFLIVWDFIHFAREQGIPVGPGRGSGAGSLVAYSMGITGIDPIRFNLLFERFINPDRISMPDFDIDFCKRRRGEVIEYVRNKYGWKNVSQIITFGTLAARNAIRDVGRVMELPFAEVDRVAKLVPSEIGVTIDQALEDSPDLGEIYRSNPQIRNVINIARKLEGLTRHASTHAAGVVIAPKPLLYYLPLFKSSKDEITTQYDMVDVESIGLIKMDFLGLRTLTVIQDTLEAIEAAIGETIDIDRLPLDDPETYKLFCAGRTCGIFQFESSGMRDILMRLKPERLEDLSALNALYRPGPIKGGLIDDYIKRRNGRKKVEYLLPEMEEITRETFGIILYQEQVMQIASRLGGFTLGEADLLRRAMGKKKKELMAQQRDHFMAGAEEHGISKKKADEVFELMAYFSGYGFNKSHSTAYALIAYQTAYLKAHYPHYFMAALLSSEMENTDKLKRFLSECRDMGIEILPPDVNKSEANFKVEGDKIRFGLAAIKGIGRGAIDNIVVAREENGPFSSLFRFCELVDLRSVNKRAVEAMIRAGAMDNLGANRAQSLMVLDRAFENGQKAMRDRLSGQTSLFGGPVDEGDQGTVETLPDVEKLSQKERLAGEKDALGFYLSGHPLQEFTAQIGSAITAKVEQLAEHNKEDVTVGGIVTELRRIKTRNGKAMAVFHLEDDTGVVETVIYPNAFNEISHRLENDDVVLVSGRAESDAESVRIVASSVVQLSQVDIENTKTVEITIDLDAMTEVEMAELLDVVRNNQGEASLVFRVKQSGSFDVDFAAGHEYRIRAGKNVVARLQNIVGNGNIRVIRNGFENGLP